jgi:hypothetical protein
MNLLWKCLSIDKLPWDDNHHRSSFLPPREEIHSISPPDVTNSPQSLILTQDTISEGNLGNISTMVIIDISIKEGVVENINIGANCTPEEVVSYTTLFK